MFYLTGAKKSRSIKKWCCAASGTEWHTNGHWTYCSEARTPLPGDDKDLDPAPSNFLATVGTVLRDSLFYMPTKYQLVLTRRWDGKAAAYEFSAKLRVFSLFRDTNVRHFIPGLDRAVAQCGVLGWNPRHTVFYLKIRKRENAKNKSM